MEKKCTICGQVLPIERFGKYRYKGKERYRSECKECRNRRTRKMEAEKRGKPVIIDISIEAVKRRQDFRDTLPDNQRWDNFYYWKLENGDIK